MHETTEFLYIWFAAVYWQRDRIYKKPYQIDKENVVSCRHYCI